MDGRPGHARGGGSLPAAGRRLGRLALAAALLLWLVLPLTSAADDAAPVWVLGNLDARSVPGTNVEARGVATVGGSSLPIRVRFWRDEGRLWHWQARGPAGPLAEGEVEFNRRGQPVESLVEFPLEDGGVGSLMLERLTGYAASTRVRLASAAPPIEPRPTFRPPRVLRPGAPPRPAPTTAPPPSGGSTTPRATATPVRAAPSVPAPGGTPSPTVSPTGPLASCAAVPPPKSSGLFEFEGTAGCLARVASGASADVTIRFQATKNIRSVTIVGLPPQQGIHVDTRQKSGLGDLKAGRLVSFRAQVIASPGLGPGIYSFNVDLDSQSGTASGTYYVEVLPAPKLP